MAKKKTIVPTDNKKPKEKPLAINGTFEGVINAAFKKPVDKK